MNAAKATGLDGLGCELYQSCLSENVARLFAVFAKTVIRAQWIPEMAGGWLLPLYKGKGGAQNMTSHRAIWSRLQQDGSPERGIHQTSEANQWGGRKGLSCSALHLQVRLWQSVARHRKQSQALVFMDIKSAFYTVAKRMLVKQPYNEDTFVQLCEVMQIPETAKDAFKRNLAMSNTIWNNMYIIKIAMIIYDIIIFYDWIWLINLYFRSPDINLNHGLIKHRCIHILNQTYFEHHQNIIIQVPVICQVPSHDLDSADVCQWWTFMIKTVDNLDHDNLLYSSIYCILFKLNSYKQLNYLDHWRSAAVHLDHHLTVQQQQIFKGHGALSGGHPWLGGRGGPGFFFHGFCCFRSFFSCFL